tara:strand:+ start:1150 stop:1785 length:636 start_codon:yes stop_codon:yes gene_type:complete
MEGIQINIDLKDVVDIETTKNTEDVVAIRNPGVVIFTDKEINIVLPLSILGLIIGFSFLFSSISELDNECYDTKYNYTSLSDDENVDGSYVDTIVGISITMSVGIIGLSIGGLMESLLYMSHNVCDCSKGRITVTRAFACIVHLIFVLILLVIPTIMFIFLIKLPDCVFTYAVFSFIYVFIALTFNLASVIVIFIILACIFPDQCVGGLGE